MFDIAAEGTQSVPPEIREHLLEPFITATRAALGEMAGAELVVRSVFETPHYLRSGDIVVELALTSTTEGPLILSFPLDTAASFARRILAEAAQPDDMLIRDCAGEIANVIAGQAKALLAGSRYQLSFSIPRILSDAPSSAPQRIEQTCLTVVFGGEHGDFALQLLLR